MKTLLPNASGNMTMKLNPCRLCGADREMGKLRNRSKMPLVTSVFRAMPDRAAVKDCLTPLGVKVSFTRGRFPPDSRRLERLAGRAGH
jgi:hypothetical protein